MWDVDKNEYIDYVCNLGPLILGHNHPKVLEAVKQQIESGFWMGAPSELEIRLAEEIIRRYPTIEKLRFCPTGSEACMNALRAVRAYTRRDKIIAAEGAHHGSSDSLYPTAGVPQDLTSKVKRVPFNNAEAVEEAVKELKHELAAVFIEPVLGAGTTGVAAKNEFLKRVREITTDHDIPLVLDEVFSGFRLSPGGAAERFGIKPEVATFGKILGGGFALGAFGGIEEIMSTFEYPTTNSLQVVNPPTRHPGTFNDQKISMAAGLATLRELTKDAYGHLEETGQTIRSGLVQLSLDAGLRTYVSGIGSIFHIHFTDEEVVDMDSATRANSLLIRYYDLNMANRGINLAKAHASMCSTPLTEKDIDKTLTAAKETLTAMKPLVHEIAPSLIL